MLQKRAVLSSDLYSESPSLSRHLLVLLTVYNGLFIPSSWFIYSLQSFQAVLNTV